MERLQPLPPRSQLLEGQAQTLQVAMAPKAKVRAKAKPKAKARAKAMVAPRAKAKGLARARGRGLRALRRPAQAREGEALGSDPRQDWDAGRAVSGGDISLDWLTGGKRLIVEEAKYFHRECKLAGTVLGTLLSGTQVVVRLRPTGTTDEGILKLQSGQPRLELRAVLCPKDCNHEEAAEDLVHVVRARQMGPGEVEAAWVNNLEKVAPREEEDELQLLREKMAMERGRTPEREAPAGETGEKKSKKVKEKERPGQERGHKQRGVEVGDHSPGWEQGAAGVPKEAAGSLQWHGARSLREGQIQSYEACQEVCQEEREEGQQQLSVLERKHKRRSLGGRIGHDFSTGGPGPGDCRLLSGGPCKPSPVSDAVQPAAELGGGRQGEHPPSCGSAVLPTGTAEESIWPGEPRVADAVCPDGHAREGQLSGTGARHCPPEGKKRRVHSGGHSLECLPETRTPPSRAHDAHRHGRDEGGPKDCLRGIKDSVDVISTRRKRFGVAKGRRKDQGSWQGRLPIWRRWQERRKRARKERRLEEEDRGDSSQDWLREEDARGVAGTGNAALKREEDRSAAMQGDQKDDAPYKGGMVVASRAVCEEKPCSRGQAALEITYETSVQSVPAAAAAPSLAAGSIDLGTGQPALELEQQRAPCGAKKGFGKSQIQGLPLGWCGADLFRLLLEVLPLRSQYMGRRKSEEIFPLPTSREVLLGFDPVLTEFEVFWCLCVCVGLNSFWGGPLRGPDELNECQKVCLLEILKDVKRFAQLKDEITDINWSEFFSVRSIDYKGDEVKVAKWFTWDNVGPALPREVGVVPLEDVCTYGCRDYVLNFEKYLKPRSEWGAVSSPRVMVSDADWPAVCRGLLSSGVCVLIPEEEIFHTDQGPLLNGLFGVSKEEVSAQGHEIFRLIMNLIPLNGLCKPISGDVDTLPSWSSMSPFFLQPHEQLLVSSEDVKCFFYVMSVPHVWTKFLAFNKLVPDEVLPSALRQQRVYLASRVLPMGFLNSVSLAQHVHRNLARWGRERAGEVGAGSNVPEAELRKDREFSCRPTNWRIYLDNYDLLEKVEKTEVPSLEGSCAAGVLSLRNEYERWGVPRNLKKAVQRSSLCELQGATVDGEAGVAYPREVKMAKYFSMAVDLCQQRSATQKQWQVVCGGLVYVSMFRRPLLGSLNQVWRHILSYDQTQCKVLATPHECKLEILRFLGMMPLARLDFRLDMHPMVTCSDASSQGGGMCASTALTSLGGMVCRGALRGECPEQGDAMVVFSIGLFDGIGALRVALEVVSVRVIGHVSVECHKSAQRVVESHYPSVEKVDSVQLIDEAMVAQWAGRYSQCSMVLIGAGPPCQGVSGLNPDRKGALRDERSNLFQEVPRVRDLVRRAFPWCPVHVLMESVASMDSGDRQVMSEGYGSDPLLCDAGDFTWCHRPRLYWLSWELEEQDTAWIDRTDSVAKLHLRGTQDVKEVIRGGWRKVDVSKAFPTFTTSRPRSKAGRKPAGVHQCSLSELERWHQDRFRFPPYQYKDINCLINGAGEIRVPDVSERELMLGFPLHYTATCSPKSDRKKEEYNDIRLSLLGNTWSVPVVAYLLSHLFSWLGWIEAVTPQSILDACCSGQQTYVQGRLARLPLNPSRQICEADPYTLAVKLGNLVSVKGEDIMLNTPTSQQVSFQRLRASVPARLWKWQVIAGWRWKLGSEHINSLELRAILTTLRWRLEKMRQVGCRLIHMTDSLVCLHALSRGRSSSRKLRRTMARVNALVLAGNVQMLWTYVHTDDNPADRPSRWGQRVKTKYRNVKKKST